jgi:hypothetical protein
VQQARRSVVTVVVRVIAGMLLVFTSPEGAFWLLEHIVTTLLPFSFNDQLIGCFVDADVLSGASECHRGMPADGVRV